MRRGALAIVALLAIAANLRGPLTSLPPLVDRISESLGLSSVAAGGLTSLPLLCMGLLAPLAPRLAVRYGLEKALGLGIALIAVGTAGRALAGAPGLYAGTVVLGTGIAIAGALVPAAVRQAVPGNIGGATSLSNVVTMTMAALAAATVTPLADRVGAPAALAVWAIPALAALVLWIPQMRGSAPSDGRARPGGRTPAGGSAPATNSAPAPSRAAAGSSAPATDSAGAAGTPGDTASRTGDGPPAPTRGAAQLPWRSRTAWLITGYLTANSLMFYVVLAWLPAAYLDLGWSPTGAGLLLGAFSTWQLLAALALTAVLHRWRGDRRVLYCSAAGLSVLGMLGVGLVPDAATWLVIAVVGIGLGGGFTLGLVQLASHVASPLDSARLSAMAFLVSFLLAAFGPTLAGLARDATGAFTSSFLALAAIATAQVLIGTRLHPRRRVGPASSLH